MADELAELRKRKIAEIQARAEAQQGEEEQLQSQIAQLDAVVKAKLSKEALSRYSNMRVAHPELWLQSVVVLAQFIQARKLASVTDEQYKGILEQLQPKKRDITIKKA